MNIANTPGDQLAKAAATFIGTRFRLHGRDDVTGLDCVGLVHASLLAIGRNPVSPEGYRIRNVDTRGWQETAAICGLYPVSGPVRPGDVVMVRPGPAQHHLVICESAGMAVHAHAGLRKVVRQPMSFPQRPLAHWRLL